MAKSIIAGTPASQGESATVTPAVSSITEVVIEIEPRGQIIWTGTKDQIAAELPHLDCTKWDAQSSSWDDGVFSYWLSRLCPKRMSGKEWKASERDHWSLHQRLVIDRGTAFAAAHIYEKREALRQELWSQTPEARVQFNRAYAARQDKAYCRFMMLAGAVKPPKKT